MERIHLSLEKATCLSGLKGTSVVAKKLKIRVGRMFSGILANLCRMSLAMVGDGFGPESSSVQPGKKEVSIRNVLEPQLTLVGN